MILENFEKILNENKLIKKDANILNSLLNEYKSKDYKNTAVVKNNISYIFLKDNIDVKDMRFICSKITEEENYMAVLVTEINNTCNLVIGQSKNLKLNIKNIFEQCKLLINGKGGGNNYLLQCSGDLLKGEECLELAKNMTLNI